MSQPNRKLVFEILANLIRNYLSEIQQMKSDFVFGFIQTMDGEKDPRNLVSAGENFLINVDDMFPVVAKHHPYYSFLH